MVTVHTTLIGARTFILRTIHTYVGYVLKMGQAERAMASMGMAMAAGKEVTSIMHGHHPQQLPCLRPHVSFRGEWGECQREARQGAKYGRAKPVSKEHSWAEISHKLNPHRRPKFFHATRPRTKQSPSPNRPNIKVRNNPKRWIDLAKLTHLQSFVDLELQKVDCIFDIQQPRPSPITRKQMIQHAVSPHQRLIVVLFF